MNENKSKIGILTYIAKSRSKGIKFEDEPDVWYNPTIAAIDQVKSKYIGKHVEIVLIGAKNEFSSMILLEPESKPKHNEEIVEEKEPTHVPVERDPKVIEETQDQSIQGDSPIEGFLKTIAASTQIKEYTKEVYSDMEKTKLETAKKGPMKLTYASWAEVWGTLKRKHPTATFEVHENENNMPVFYDPVMLSMGGFVKVSVTVLGLEHTVHLPVMNHSNKSIPMTEMTTFDINKNIQRAFAKCMAMHGIGLYVFKGEDYPEDKKGI